MLIIYLLVSCTVLVLVNGQEFQGQPGYDLSYRPRVPNPYGEAFCSRLPSSHTCCSDRRDECSTPRGTTRCYCDSFCNKHGPNQDCCPDYESFCNGIPGPNIFDSCPYEGTNYNIEDRFRLRDPCYTCTCKKISAGVFQLHCEYVCDPKPRDYCPYSSIDYPEGGYVNIGDTCYTCNCERSWYGHITIKCNYICFPTEPTESIYVCQHENRFYRAHETIRENCRVCTCQERAQGVYDVTCYADPSCAPPAGCHYNSQVYKAGSQIRIGQQECTCTQLADSTAQFFCTDPPTQPQDPVAIINAGSYGWLAYRYSFLSSYTMEEIFRTRTGVCRPDAQQYPYALTVASGLTFQNDTFDARTQWPGFVRPISDAENQPTSWAITIAALAADHKAIETQGRENQHLSVQNLISCVRQSSDCSSSTKGWEYLQTYGIVSEECYPRNSHGANTCQVDIAEHLKVATTCPSGSGYGKLLRHSRPRQMSTNEIDIRLEIANRGPVQAHVRVREDFFYYRSGVYRHVYGNLYNNREYYLAVRIIGWGTDLSTGTPIKYWICANSWGINWGENGYFRILRGTNECEIEEYVFSLQ